MSSYRKVKLMDVWEVTRHDEDQRFSKYDFITNRRLLWHGTKCAVVASCLEGGLRIMPHSGGRVGKGIYLASEHGKSVNYTWPGRKGGKQIGVMFLVEAALGTEHHILRDDPSLKAPPAGYHSIVALGHKEPDPKKDTTIVLDSKPVVVPQGPPIHMPRGNGSNFDQTEYLVYDEAQHRIRFVCTFEF
jgi:poly [ADP-ribose] polymerase